MSFSPVVPLSGYAGWTYLKRTMTAQQTAFTASPQRQRDADYFREKIGTITTAEELVSDRRLLRVALGAYGLDSDINNRFFIRKVLEEGTLKEGALALRLADPHYRELSAAFGFGDFSIPNTQISDFADKTLAAYERRQFEAAVGEQSDTLRLALNAERELPLLAAKSSSEDTKWYSVMGSAPLRQVFQTVLGLPSSFAAIDIDQQLGVLKEKSDRMFGSEGISQFADADKMTKLIRTFVTRSDASTLPAAAGGAAALQLLQASSRSGSALLSLLR